MYFSKNNILVELDKDDEWRYVLFNSLIGNVDFLNDEFYQYVRALQDPAGKKKADPEKDGMLSSRGYLFRDKQEEEEKTKEFVDFFIKEKTEKSRNTYFLNPRNTCGFGCAYCKYEHLLDGSCIGVADLRKMMDFIDENEKKSITGNKPYLGLMGFETLPDNEEGYILVKTILEEYMDRFSHVNFSTTGRHLGRYKELILNSSLEKISFRFTLMENETQMKDDSLLPPDVEVSLEWLRMHGLRTVMDVKITENNVENMPDYVNYFIEKGVAFSENCVLMFKPTMEGNCSLFSPCTANYELYEKVYRIFEEYPQLEFARFSGGGMAKVIQFLLKMRERFSISTIFCEANLSLFVVAASGHIHACYHGLQNPAVAVGNIHQSPALDEQKLALWRGRDVREIESCSGCPAKFVCSGGCTYEALTKKGSYNQSNCQPYLKLLKWAFESLHEDFLESERLSELETFAEAEA